MQVQLRKEPHVQQQKFIDSKALEQLYGGAKRGGKSVALCQKAILLSVLFPGNRGLLTRKDFTDLNDTTLNEFWQVCPPELVVEHHKGDRRITLRTIHPQITSDILYRGLGGPEDVEKAKSLNLGWFGIDEPSELAFETYKMLRAQLTWVLPNGKRPPYMALLASNPEPGWVKERFITTPQAGCVFIPALPRDNPHLPPGWEDELRQTYDQEWVDKYLGGSWDVTEGQVFPELTDRIHAINPFDTTGLKLVGAIDHATTGITAFVIVGIDADDNIFALHEYYKENQIVSFHSSQIKSLMGKYTPRVDPPKVQQKVDYVLIDPSTTRRTQVGNSMLQSVADLYREQGIIVVPGWNALEAGLQRIKEYLHVKPNHMHPISGLKGAPSLFIVKRYCPNLWKEMRELKKEILPMGSVRFVGIDHALDCLRYIINSRPKRPDFSPKDWNNLSAQDRFFTDVHKRWAKKFGQGDAPTGSWF